MNKQEGGCCDHDHGPTHHHHHNSHGHQHDHNHDEHDCCSHDHNHIQLYEPKPRLVKQFELKKEFQIDGITYVQYKDETQMPHIMNLITKDLSEPYSIYTYRYFIHIWPHLSFLAMCDNEYVGVIVCKLDTYKDILRGYIAMLAVNREYRRKKIGSHLVTTAIKAMCMHGADEVVLETELSNKAALKLYENLGFVRDKRLFRYYLNGVDAFRLKLWLK